MDLIKGIFNNLEVFFGSFENFYNFGGGFRVHRDTSRILKYFLYS